MGKVTKIFKTGNSAAARQAEEQAAAARAQTAELARQNAAIQAANEQARQQQVQQQQAALQQQQNAAELGSINAGTGDIADVVSGGTAAEAAAGITSGRKRKQGGLASSLGINV